MAIHHRTARILTALLLALAFLAHALPTAASEPSPSTAIDIINQVNILRASYGLAPYQVDANVMAFAQQHSEYQASIRTATHNHSDGTTSLAHGMRENIATGMLGYMTPEFAVYTVWADDIHMDPMIGYASGFVGAGVADDGTDVYYTLNVRPGDGKAGGSGGAPGKTPGTPAAVIPIVPLATVTPRPDGWNVHTVGYGQTLWAIAQAYGVPADMIRAWNSMEADSNEIYAGQKLIIRAPTGVVATQGAAGTAAAQATETSAASQAQANDAGVPETGAEWTTSTIERPPATVVAAANTMAPAPGALTTLSPSTPTSTPEDPPAGAENGPLAAGLLILVGGTLLVFLAFALVRKN